MHDRASPERPVLPEALLHKAVAVKLQLEAWDRELLLAQLQARVAVLEREVLRRNLPPLEAQLLAALDAPPGATFNWQTLTGDPPPHEADHHGPDVHADHP